VITATTEVVISLKSNTALRRLDFNATVVSRMSTILTVNGISLIRDR